MALFKNKYRIESNRLKNWDYSSTGFYFITICTKNMECFFGEIIGDKMKLSPIGEIVTSSWSKIPEFNSNVRLDEWVVMPNHIHGIIVINKCENHNDAYRNDNHNDIYRCRGRRCRRDVLLKRLYSGDKPNNINNANNTDNYYSRISPTKGSLSVILRTYKTVITKWCMKNDYKNFKWQDNYYEHIIRDEQSLENIRQYIRNNPRKWELDRNNPCYKKL